MYILEVYEDSILIGDKLVEINAVSIRFMRRIQVAQYEPAEVEFTLHATLDEGEDHLKAGKTLAKDSRAMIKEAFSGLLKLAEKETETPPAEEKPKNKGGRPPGSKNKPKEVETPSETPTPIPDPAGSNIPSDPPVDNGIPSGDGSSEIPTATPPPVSEIPDVDGPAPSEIPGEGDPVVPIAEEPLTLKDLQAFITEKVTKPPKSLTSGNIRDVLGTFNLGRTADLSEEQVPLFKDALDLLIAQVTKK